MLDWDDRKKLIEEYKKDLKDLRRQHKAISCKRYTYAVKEHGKQVDKISDDRTAEELAAQKVIAEAISTTEYALFWLIEGRERTFEDTSKVTDLSKEQREELWGDIKEMESFHKLADRPTKIHELSSDDQRILSEVIGLMDQTEKDIFISIYGEQNTEELTAEYLKMTKSAVKYYKKRIQNKIDDYNCIGYQLSFC